MEQYATRAQLVAYVGTSVSLPSSEEQDRLLKRATELLSPVVTTPYAIDSLTKLPTETHVANGFKDAVCAQVEWWLVTGDEKEAAARFEDAGMGGLSLKTKTRYAPRAIDALRNAGLLNGPNAR